MHSASARGSGWFSIFAVGSLVALLWLSADGAYAQPKKFGWRIRALFSKKKECPSCLDGEEAPEWHPCRLREWPGRSFLGRGDEEHTFHRAGYPNEPGKILHPTDNGYYVGYYVGGGSIYKKKTRGPGPLDGTFGWDYKGPKWLNPFVALRWGRRYQGGVGAYKIDGPQIPDVGPLINEIPKGPVRSEEGEGEEH